MTQPASDRWVHKKAVQIPITVAYGIIFLVGFLGNIGILYILFKRSRFYLACNILLANLCLAQLVLCTTSFPIGPIPLIQSSLILPRLMCKILPIAQTASVMVTGHSLCCIAIDRYWHIVHQMAKRMKRQVALIFIICSWSVSIFLNLPLVADNDPPYLNGTAISNLTTVPLLGQPPPPCFENAWRNFRGPKMLYGSFMFVFQFVLPVVIMSFCYWRISLKVHREFVVKGHIPSMLQAAALHRKRRVVRILICMVLAFVISWLPLSVINLLQDFGFIPQQHILLHISSHLIATMSTIWNPTLYFWLSSSHLTDLKKEISQQIAGIVWASKKFTSSKVILGSSPVKRSSRSSSSLMDEKNLNQIDFLQGAVDSSNEGGCIDDEVSMERKSFQDPFADAVADSIVRHARKKLMTQRKSCFPIGTKKRNSNHILVRSWSENHVLLGRIMNRNQTVVSVNC